MPVEEEGDVAELLSGETPGLPAAEDSAPLEAVEVADLSVVTNGIRYAARSLRGGRAAYFPSDRAT